jgi:photosystem II stability/assembly factor-like uncharacterized protein
VGYEPGGKEDGVNLTTSDGGTRWVNRVPDTEPDLFSVSCWSVRRCTAVGRSVWTGQAAVLETADGGATWAE